MNIDMNQLISAEDKQQTSLRSHRSTTQAHLHKVLSDLSMQLTGATPLVEQLSWMAKETAARSHQAGTATQSDLQILNAEAQETGETLSDLAELILSKASTYRQATSFIAGTRRKYTTRIEAASSTDDLETIVVNLQADLDRFPGAR